MSTVSPKELRVLRTWQKEDKNSSWMRKNCLNQLRSFNGLSKKGQKRVINRYKCINGYHVNIFEMR